MGTSRDLQPDPHSQSTGILGLSLRVFVVRKSCVYGGECLHIDKCSLFLGPFVPGSSPIHGCLAPANAGGPDPVAPLGYSPS